MAAPSRRPGCCASAAASPATSVLRQRRGFTGDIRATGDVLVDQLVQMYRVGFSSAVLKEGKDPADAERQFARYRDFYQGDAVVKQPLFARS
jgi:uncharacterized protein (DUF934 family)